jgi:hypothetical protein
MSSRSSREVEDHPGFGRARLPNGRHTVAEALTKVEPAIGRAE